MKTPIVKSILMLASLWTFGFHPATATAQGTAFSYQGRLSDQGAPANGVYDVAFTLYATNLTGTALAGPVTNAAVAVSNGLFTVTLDFGPGFFDGGPRWLGLGARTNGAAGFTALTPRQPLSPVPYAIFAGSASNAVTLTGTVPAAGLSGTYANPINFTNPANSFTGNGAGVAGVNAALLTGLAASNFWQTAGNAGTSPANGRFLGTTDHQPLELRVDGGRALRIEPGATNGSPNLIGGSSVNYVSGGIVGAVIGGGGTTNFFGIAYTNSVLGDFGAIGGGLGNTTVNYYGTVAGGIGNSAGGGSAVVGGGAYNYAGNDYSAAVGGFGNLATGAGAFIGGGGADGNNYQGNQTAGNASFIGGGMNNKINAGADDAAIVSGQGGIVDVNSFHSAIVGGEGNWIGTDTDHSFIAGGLNNSMLLPGGGTANVIGGGENNAFNGDHVSDSVISGGIGNQIQGSAATIGGGENNQATNRYSTVGGGIDNVASGVSATVAGGGQGSLGAITDLKPHGSTLGAGNTASGDYSSILGGRRNTASGYASTIGGGDGNTASLDDTFIGGGWGNNAQNYDATVSGGDNNTAGGYGTVVAGGEQNNAGGDFAIIGGGHNNNGAGAADTIAGGYNNSSGGGNNSTISGGNNNNSSGNEAVIGGGQANQVSAFFTTIGGGVNNLATNDTAVVSGGTNNVSGGYAATVAGGSDNQALGDYSFAAGNFAQATNNHSFVWSDGSTNTVSTTNNQFVARAGGGFMLYSAAAGTGVSLAPGSGSWSSMSDRNAKNGFAPVNAKSVLAQVAALPLTTWSYNTEPGVRHVGPMAQDFYAAFNVGEDNRHITEVDEGGVALAAIQGLNQKLEQKDTEITELKARLEKLEQLINQQNGGAK